MSKMADALQCAALRRELGLVKAQLSTALYDLNLVAAELCRTGEFLGWLMEQDASSAETFSPGKPRKNVEEKSDIELAKLYIAATVAG